MPRVSTSRSISRRCSSDSAIYCRKIFSSSGRAAGAGWSAWGGSRPTWLCPLPSRYLGLLRGVCVSLVHTETPERIHIISFRKATKNEHIIFFHNVSDRLAAAHGAARPRHYTQCRASSRRGGPYRPRHCPPGLALRSPQNADFPAGGCRCAGVVQSAGRQLSDPDERDVTGL